MVNSYYQTEAVMDSSLLYSAETVHCESKNWTILFLGISGRGLWWAGCFSCHPTNSVRAL